VKEPFPSEKHEPEKQTTGEKSPVRKGANFEGPKSLCPARIGKKSSIVKIPKGEGAPGRKRSSGEKERPGRGKKGERTPLRKKEASASPDKAPGKRGKEEVQSGMGVACGGTPQKEATRRSLLTERQDCPAR